LFYGAVRSLASRNSKTHNNKASPCLTPKKHLSSGSSADDHRELREPMRSVLSLEADFRVVAEAQDGLEAVELCRLHRPDLVIMDKSMPRVNGLEATRSLKEELPETKVLIVSVDHLSRSEVAR
jgi:DNA-binding NarL/FixJ family response regulator